MAERDFDELYASNPGRSGGSRARREATLRGGDARPDLMGGDA
jgi:hypothetical protein